MAPYKPQPNLGESFIGMCMLVWMSIAVGPWWIGPLLLVGGFLVNLRAASRS